MKIYEVIDGEGRAYAPKLGAARNIARGLAFARAKELEANESCTVTIQEISAGRLTGETVCAMLDGDRSAWVECVNIVERFEATCDKKGKATVRRVVFEDVTGGEPEDAPGE